MESSLDYKNFLIIELSKGRELARQLQIHLNVSSSSHEARELLVHKILNSYQKVLTMLNWNGSVQMADPEPNIEGTRRYSDSPGSFNGSPKSDDSDRDFEDHGTRTESKKRKSVPRWTQQVRVCPGTGLEGPLDDGYSWRKYGQKDILGAKYPRSYYRCTHRNIQGCLATKQVQRSDDDPTLFEITYRGQHACNNCSPLNNQRIPQLASPENKVEPNATSSYHQQTRLPQQNQHQHQHQHQNQNQNQNQSQDFLLSFKTDLKVITADLQTQNHNFPSNKIFPTNYNNNHYPSASHVKGENISFSPPTMGNTFSGNYFSPQVISPATSFSGYHSVSPNHVAGFEEARIVNVSDSELIDIVSTTTSVNNSPTMGLDFPFGHMDPFEPSFSFDYTSFFSNF